MCAPRSSACSKRSSTNTPRTLADYKTVPADSRKGARPPPEHRSGRESARIAAKPAIVIGVTAASLLPQIITSASPRRIAAAPLADSMRAGGAGRDDRQIWDPAVPKRIEIAPAAVSVSSMGMRKGLKRLGPRAAITANCGLQRLDAANAGTDKHADAICVFCGYIETRVVHGLLRRRDGVLREAVHPPRLARTHVQPRVEALYLTGNLHCEARGIKPANARDS